MRNFWHGANGFSGGLAKHYEERKAPIVDHLNTLRIALKMFM